MAFLRFGLNRLTRNFGLTCLLLLSVVVASAQTVTFKLSNTAASTVCSEEATSGTQTSFDILIVGGGSAQYTATIDTGGGTMNVGPIDENVEFQQIVSFTNSTNAVQTRNLQLTQVVPFGGGAPVTFTPALPRAMTGNPISVIANPDYDLVGLDVNGVVVLDGAPDEASLQLNPSFTPYGVGFELTNYNIQEATIANPASETGNFGVANYPVTAGVLSDAVAGDNVYVLSNYTIGDGVNSCTYPSTASETVFGLNAVTVNEISSNNEGQLCGNTKPRVRFNLSGNGDEVVAIMDITLVGSINNTFNNVEYDAATNFQNITEVPNGFTGTVQIAVTAVENRKNGSVNSTAVAFTFNYEVNSNPNVANVVLSTDTLCNNATDVDLNFDIVASTGANTGDSWVVGYTVNGVVMTPVIFETDGAQTITISRSDLGAAGTLTNGNQYTIQLTSIDEYDAPAGGGNLICNRDLSLVPAALVQLEIFNNPVVTVQRSGSFSESMCQGATEDIEVVFTTPTNNYDVNWTVNAGAYTYSKIKNGGAVDGIITISVGKDGGGVDLPVDNYVYDAASIVVQPFDANAGGAPVCPYIINTSPNGSTLNDLLDFTVKSFDPADPIIQASAGTNTTVCDTSGVVANETEISLDIIIDTTATLVSGPFEVTYVKRVTSGGAVLQTYVDTVDALVSATAYGKTVTNALYEDNPTLQDVEFAIIAIEEVAVAGDSPNANYCSASYAGGTAATTTFSVKPIPAADFSIVNGLTCLNPAAANPEITGTLQAGTFRLLDRFRNIYTVYEFDADSNLVATTSDVLDTDAGANYNPNTSTSNARMPFDGANVLSGIPFNNGNYFIVELSLRSVVAGIPGSVICDSRPLGTVDVYRQPNPEVSFIDDMFSSCSGEDVEVTINIDNLLPYAFSDLTYNIQLVDDAAPVGTYDLTGSASRVGTNDSITFTTTVAPLAGAVITYDIVDVNSSVTFPYLEAGNNVCEVTEVVPNQATIDVTPDRTPTLTVSSATVCEGDDITLTLANSLLQVGDEAYVTVRNAITNDFIETLTFTADGGVLYTVNDSLTFAVDSIRTSTLNNSSSCLFLYNVGGRPTVQTGVTMNPLLSATFVSLNDSIVCAADQPAFGLVIEGPGNITVTYDIRTNAGGAVAGGTGLTFTNTAGTFDVPVNFNAGLTRYIHLVSVSSDAYVGNCPNDVVETQRLRLRRNAVPTVDASDILAPNVCSGDSVDISVLVTGTNNVDVSFDLEFRRQSDNALFDTQSATLSPQATPNVAVDDYIIARDMFISVAPGSVVDENGCTGTAGTTVIAINEVPQFVLTTTVPDFLCGDINDEADGEVRFEVATSGPADSRFIVNYRAIGDAGFQSINIPIDTTFTDHFIISGGSSGIEIQSISDATGTCVNTPTPSIIPTEIISVPNVSILNTSETEACVNAGLFLEFNLTNADGTNRIYFSDNAGGEYAFTAGVSGIYDTTLFSIPVGNYIFKLDSVVSLSGSGLECNGTVDPAQHTAEIYALPTTTFTVNRDTVCSGDAVTFTANALTASNDAIDVYTSTNGFATQTYNLTDASPNFTTGAITADTVIVIDSIIDVNTGCVTYLNDTFRIKALTAPTATFDLASDKTICQGSSATLRLNLTGVAPYSIELEDENGTPISLTTSTNTVVFTVSPTDTMTYTITQLVDDNQLGCPVGTFVASYTVNVVERPQFVAIDTPDEVCQGTTDSITFVLNTANMPAGQVLKITYRDANGVKSRNFTTTNSGVNDTVKVVSAAINNNTDFELLSIQNTTTNPACTFNYGLISRTEIIAAPTVTMDVTDGAICDDGSITATVNISGSGLVNFEILREDDPGNPVSFTNRNTNTPQIIQFDNVRWTGDYTNFTVQNITSATAGTFCVNSLNVTDSVRVYREPTVDLYRPDNSTNLMEICQSDEIELNIEVGGQGGTPVTVSLLDTNGVVYDYQLDTNTITTITIPASTLPLGQWSIWLNFAQLTQSPGCQNLSGSDTLRYNVVEAPTAVISTDPSVVTPTGATEVTIIHTPNTPNVEYSVQKYQPNGTKVGAPRIFTGLPNDTTTFTDVVETTSGATAKIGTWNYKVEYIELTTTGCRVENPSDVNVQVIDEEAVIFGEDNICTCDTFYFNARFGTDDDYQLRITQTNNGVVVLNQLFTNLNNTDNEIAIQVCDVGLSRFQITEARNTTTGTDVDFNNNAAIVNVSDQSGVLTLPNNSTAVADTVICEGTPLSIRFATDGPGSKTIRFTNLDKTSFVDQVTTPAGSQEVVRVVGTNNMRLGLNTFRVTQVISSNPGGSCALAVDSTFTVYVRPRPAGDIVFDPPVACAQDPVNVIWDSEIDSLFTIVYTSATYGGGTETVHNRVDSIIRTIPASGVTNNHVFRLDSIYYNDMPGCAAQAQSASNYEFDVLPQPVATVTRLNGGVICEYDSAAFTVTFTTTPLGGTIAYPVTFTITDGLNVDSNITFYNTQNTGDTTFYFSAATDPTFSIEAGTFMSANGCTGTTNGSAGFTSQAAPIISNISPRVQTICEGDQAFVNFDLTFDNQASFAELFYDFPNGIPRTVRYASNGTKTRGFSTTVTDTAFFTRLRDSQGCFVDLDDTLIFNVVAKPIIKRFEAQPNLVCEGEDVRIVLDIDTKGQRMTFDIQDQNGNTWVMLQDTLSGLYEFTLTAEEAGGFDFSKDFTLTIDSAFNQDPNRTCGYSNLAQLQVFVNTAPKAADNLFTIENSPICEGQELEFKLNKNNQQAQQWTYYFEDDQGNTFTMVLPAGATEATDFYNPFPRTGNITYFLRKIEYFERGRVCTAEFGNTVSKSVIVHPTPEVLLDADPREICLFDANGNPGQTDLIFDMVGTGPYEVRFSDNFGGEYSTTISGSTKRYTVFPTQTTTYEIDEIIDKGQSNLGCSVNSPNSQVTVRVNENPTVELLQNTAEEICLGQSTTIDMVVRGRAPIDLYVTAVSNDTNIRYAFENVGTGNISRTFTLPTPEVYTIFVDSIADANAPVCNAEGLGVLTVDVRALPEVRVEWELEDGTDVTRFCQNDEIFAHLFFGAGTVTHGNDYYVEGGGQLPYTLTYNWNGKDSTITVNRHDTIIVLAAANTGDAVEFDVVSLRDGDPVRCSNTNMQAAPFTIDINENPTFVWRNLGAFCDGDLIAFTADITGHPNFEVTFNTDDGGPGTITQNSNSSGFGGGAGTGSGFGDDLDGTYTFEYEINPYFNINRKDTLVVRTIDFVDGNGCMVQNLDEEPFVVNPIPTATWVRPQYDLCEDSEDSIYMNISGFGDITVTYERIVNEGQPNETRTTLIAKGIEDNSPIAVQVPTDESANYWIRTVESANGTICVNNTPDLTLVNILEKPTPTVTVSKSPACDIDPLTITINFDQLDNPNINFDVYGYTVEVDPVTRLPIGTEEHFDFFNRVSQVQFIRTFSAPTTIVVDSVYNRVTGCWSLDSIGLYVPVSPSAQLEFLGDNVFCNADKDDAFFTVVLHNAEGSTDNRFRFQDSNTNQSTVVSIPNGTDTIRIRPSEYGMPLPGIGQFFTYSLKAGSFTNNSTPNCVNPIAIGQSKIRIVGNPRAEFAGQADICEGSGATVRFNLYGSAQDDVEVTYDVITLGDTTTGTFVDKGRGNPPYNVPFTPSDSTVYIPTSVEYVNIGCSVGIVDGEAAIHVRPAPEARFVSNLEFFNNDTANICNDGSNLTVDIVLDQAGEFEVTYKITPDPKGPGERTERFVEGSFNVEDYSPTQDTKFEITKVIYSSVPRCTSLVGNVDELLVKVYDPIATLNDTIDAYLCNDLATEYQMQITKTGGLTDWFTVENTTLGVTDTLVNTPDLTRFYPNGPFDVTIGDTSGCAPVRFVGNYNCDCLSDAGTPVNQTPVVVCEDELLIVNFDANTFEDANDTTVYVLHTSPTNGTLGDILATSATDTFAYNPSIQYGVTYYVSRVVADTGSYFGFNQNDPCLSDKGVSNGVPVIFNQRSTMFAEILLNDSGEVCVDDQLRFKVSFTGTGPYSFDAKYNDGSFEPFTGIVVDEETFEISVPITEITDEIIFRNFADAGNASGCATNITVLNGTVNDRDTVSLIARPRPDATFNLSKNLVCANEPVTANVATPAAGQSYVWRTDGNLYNGDPLTVSYQPNFANPGENDMPINLTVTNNFGCIDTATRVLVVDSPEDPSDYTLSNLTNEDQVGPPFCFRDSYEIDPVIGGSDRRSVWIRTSPTDSVSLVENGAHIERLGESPRTYEFIIVSETSNGCRASHNVSINSTGPEYDIIQELPIACTKEEINFRIPGASRVNVATWTWNEVSLPKNQSNIETFNLKYPEGGIGVKEVVIDVTGVQGCVLSDTFNFEIFQATIDDTTITSADPENAANGVYNCFGFGTTFDVDATESQLPLNYKWTFGDGLTGDTETETITYLSSGMKTVRVSIQDGRGCKDTLDFDWEVKALPNIAAIGDSICYDNLTFNGEDALLVATGANDGGFYEWTFVSSTVAGSTGSLGGTNTSLEGEDGVLLNPTSPPAPEPVRVDEVYEVKGYDQFGCTNTDLATLRFFTLADPRATAALNAILTANPTDTAFKIGYELDVDFDVNYRDIDGDGVEEEEFNFVWNPPFEIGCDVCPITTIRPTTSREYTINISDIYGCYDFDRSVAIDVELEASVDMPDAFTPNGDGTNEKIGPDGWAIAEVVSFEIYDRYGELVHSASGTKADVAWDGKFDGKLMAADNYAFKVVVRTLLGNQLSATGNFRLIR